MKCAILLLFILFLVGFLNIQYSADILTKVKKMSGFSNYHFLSLAVILLLIAAVDSSSSENQPKKEKKVKTAVFLSPKFVLKPGSVANKYYYNVGFPKGHIAIKEFNAEVVDEAGNPVPLYHTYLHHWVIVRYYQRKGVEPGRNQSDLIIKKNAGICDNDVLHQYFGLGSETRKTATHVPDPYGIEVGNPDEVPNGYEEQWVLNVHAIETRGAKERLGCIECRCDLYNVMKDEDGHAIEPDYVGGLRCCYDGTRCRVKKGFHHGSKKGLYLKYTVKYVDWDPSIVPVKIYILDVTDSWKKPLSPTAPVPRHSCNIEYTVVKCSADVSNGSCKHTKSLSVPFPHGGDVIYGVAHQHTAGVGSSLHGEDGRVICASRPTYGKGKGPGNEAGFIVGMSTCYPTPGSVKIIKGETVTLMTNYSSARRHTGVMGLFYLLVAEPRDKAI